MVHRAPGPAYPTVDPRMQRLAREGQRRMQRDGDKLQDLPPVYQKAVIGAPAQAVGPERAQKFHASFGGAQSSIDQNASRASLSAQVNEDIKERSALLQGGKRDQSMPVRLASHATDATSFGLATKTNQVLDTAHAHYAEKMANGDKSLVTKTAAFGVGIADSFGINRVLDPKSTVAQTSDGLLNLGLTLAAGPAGKLGKAVAASETGLKLEARLANTMVGKSTLGLGRAVTRPLGKQKAPLLADPECRATSRSAQATARTRSSSRRSIASRPAGWWRSVRAPATSAR